MARLTSHGVTPTLPVAVGNLIVERTSDGGTTWQTVGTVDGSASSFADTGFVVTHLRTYAYRLSATNAAGTSTASTSDDSSTATTDTSMPTISNTVADDGTVTITWSCDSDNVAGF